MALEMRILVIQSEEGDDHGEDVQSGFWDAGVVLFLDLSDG